MKKIVTALMALTSMGLTAAEQCVFKRYAINGSDLQVGDRVELSINASDVELVISEDNKLAHQWPKALGEKVHQEVHSNIASVGDLNNLINLKRYLATESATGNVLDVFFRDYLATLSVNGVESTAALSETYEAADGYAREVDLPHWVVTSGDNAWVYITNVSEEKTTINLEFSDQSGSTLTSGVTPYGFASGNPFDVNGAELGAGKSAYVHIASTNPFKYGTGKLKWITSSCEPVKLMVSINQTTSRSTQVFRLNGGNPIK